jgi:hypothetical protein
MKCIELGTVRIFDLYDQSNCEMFQGSFPSPS